MDYDLFKFEQSESIKALASSLLSFHASDLKIKKGARNDFFKNTYADLPSILDAVRGPLNSAGLVLVQFPGHEGLESVLIHAESGEWMRMFFPIKATKEDPQGIGSAITYARRYSICAILQLNVDDDDGNAASRPTRQPAESAHSAATAVFSTLEWPITIKGSTKKESKTPGKFYYVVDTDKGQMTAFKEIEPGNYRAKIKDSGKFKSIESVEAI